MKQYLDLCRHVLEHGVERKDRTGTGTISTFGYQMRFNLEEGFPLLTTKKVALRIVLGELLWFITGNTNIQPLVKDNIRIWNEWPYEKFKKSAEFKGETQDEFIKRIAEDDEFAKKWGDLGPVYGHQWRDFFGVDQIKRLEKNLREDPFSRRHILCAWNPAQIDQMALPPCHSFIQFYVSADGKKLSCQLYQRSGDVFLGVPFNIASYSLLTHMLANVLGIGVGEFVHTIGDTHIYKDHIEQVNLQLTRTPRPLPKLIIKRHCNSITEFTADDFELVGYDPYPVIKGKVSV